MKDMEKCLDSQLWHACAGGMVQMPPLNSKVYYYPQGHMEHEQSSVDFENSLRIPPQILCRVISVKYMADPESDEVFAKVQMIPLKVDDPDFSENDGVAFGSSGPEVEEKPSSFAKTLTQSDANNGGGFSVPRYCAETIFPRLDYSADPPVQTILAKDVHGKDWKFRHIYRGTPRRHLLTTGWSNFVNEKKLVAGDSIVFLRTNNGDLCVGIRRAKRGIGGVPEPLVGWNHPSGNCMYGGLSVFMRQEEKDLVKDNGEFKAASVIETAKLAAGGQPFEVVYYPRTSAPEFFVKASLVRSAMRVNWCSGMRFKMAFETEDSSRISWFMGKVSLVKFFDPIRWHGSPWRLLQVSWDEPNLLQNVKCVNPWLVELVLSMPSIHLTSFSPPRKKPRIPQHPDFSIDVQLSSTPLPGNPLITSRSSPLCCPPDCTPAAGIQGARHSQYGISSPFHARFSQLNCFTPSHRISTGLVLSNSTSHEDLASLLTIGNPSQTSKKECLMKTPHFLLFGKPIFTEQQLCLSTNSFSDASVSAIQQSGILDNSSSEDLPYHHDHEVKEVVLEMGHCKVFMELDDVGRTLDLSVFSSYEELYGRLANMFGIEKPELIRRILYRDSAGVIKHIEDEPFAEFMKVARRLTILMDSGSNKIDKLKETGLLKCKLEGTASSKLAVTFI
ncbi:hypothetical protein HPP92_004787 [Vanilla planifolia]|uniref:Auxin response factor n=1 Tax=Vanilla planifolia TaxID=51239 RepID=A0A835VDZ2_VANPL|nr:hypothetical protein HPP92_004787 [Vanilla planifolia]